MAGLGLADIDSVSTFTLPLLLVATAVAVLAIAVKQERIHVALPGFIPTKAQVENKAGGSVATANLGSAATAMQAYVTEFGTYAGATLPGGTGTTIVRADASAFCLQYGTGEGITHLTGPNGEALPGPC